MAARRVIVGVVFLFGAGCSSSNNTSGTPDEIFGSGLEEVGGLLRDFSTDTGRAPTRLGDVAKNEPLYPRGYQAIKSRSVTVIWGVKMPPEGQGGEEIIAYETQTGTKGGYVLSTNGKVKKMSADEFNSAPRAK
jgi:hypothetical protein